MAVDFTLDDEALAVISLIRQVLEREDMATAVRNRPETAADDRACWQRLAGLGAAGLRAPGPVGLGLGLLEVAAALEETGRALLPDDLAGANAVVRILAAAGGPVGEKHAETIVSGERTVGFDPDPRTHLDHVGSAGARLTGSSVTGTARVMCAPRPEVLALLIAGGGLRDVDDGFREENVLLDRAVSGPAGPAGPAVVLVGMDGPGVTTRMDATDPSVPYADVTFNGAAAEIVPLTGDGWRSAPDEVRLLRAAVAVGAMGAVLAETVDYLKVREQFGRPIGSFQAVKHQVADMWATVEQARAAVRLAAVALDAGLPSAARDTAVAVAFTTTSYLRISQRAVHLHGGMGYAWESGLHLHVRRALVLPRLVCDPQVHRATVFRSLLESGEGELGEWNAVEQSRPAEEDR